MGLVFSSQKQIDTREKDADDFANKLRNEGHNCIRVIETYPPVIAWCKQDICNTLEERF